MHVFSACESKPHVQHESRHALTSTTPAPMHLSRSALLVSDRLLPEPLAGAANRAQTELAYELCTAPQLLPHAARRAPISLAARRADCSTASRFCAASLL